MKQTRTAGTVFRDAHRPDIALITNHGYGGADIPVGGAPDTGGQNLYVNSLALALERLGYRVTVFARGGFPYFDGERVRREPEYLGEHVRYVFVPGGGDEFLRKEEIAVALDEELDWLERFIDEEAHERGCEPWDYYEMVNTHYWDAAVLAVRLVERWRDRVAANAVVELLREKVRPETLESTRAAASRRALGRSVAYNIGAVLIEDRAASTAPSLEHVQSAARRLGGERAEQAVRQALAEVRAGDDPVLGPVVAAEALGQVVLDLAPEPRARLERELGRIDRHVWTPHSLGELKDENFRDRPDEERRQLRFCERRSHERMVCDRTPSFAATSFEIAVRLRTHFGVPMQRVFYFPPCVDSERFRSYGGNERKETYAYLSELSGVAVDLLERARIVFETSRMDRSKRKDLLLDAFAEAAPENCYLFIGGGPENDLFHALRRKVEESPFLRERAFLCGFVPDRHIGPLFSIADVYGSPTEMEGFGMSVAQAAAAETAILTNELTPFSVQYAPDDAVIAKSGDVPDFARGLSRLLDDDTDRLRRARALSKVARALDWESQTSEFLEHLRRGGMEIARGRRER